MIALILKNGKKILSQKQTNIFSAAFTIALTMLLSAFLGILRDRLLYAHFYATQPNALDAYNAAFKLPDILFQLLVTGSLSAAFIPIFSQLLDKEKEKADRVASTIINVVTVLFLALGAIIFIFARPFSQLITADLAYEDILLMTSLTRLLLIAQFFLLISNLISGIIHSHQRFILPSLSPVIYNLGIIAGIIFLSPRLGIYGPTIGVIIGALGHLLIQLPLLKHLDFSFHPLRFYWQQKEVKKIGRLMIPRTISLGISEIEAIIIIYWATFIGQGALSLFYLAQHLSYLPIRLLGAAIGQASLPILSHLAHNKKLLKKTLKETILQTIFLVTPVCALFVTLRLPLVRLAFGARTFPWQATITTGKVLAIFSLAIFCQTINEILQRSFYVLCDTTTVLKVNASTTLLNIIFLSLLIKESPLGIIALALGISLSQFLRTLFFLIILRKKLSFAIALPDYQEITKIAAAALGGAFVAWGLMTLLDRLLDTRYVFPLIILTVAAAAGGLLTYFLFSFLFKISTGHQFFALIKKKVSPWMSASQS